MQVFLTYCLRLPVSLLASLYLLAWLFDWVSLHVLPMTDQSIIKSSRLFVSVSFPTCPFLLGAYPFLPSTYPTQPMRETAALPIYPSHLSYWHTLSLPSSSILHYTLGINRSTVIPRSGSFSGHQFTFLWTYIHRDASGLTWPLTYILRRSSREERVISLNGYDLTFKKRKNDSHTSKKYNQINTNKPLKQRMKHPATPD